VVQPLWKFLSQLSVFLGCTTYPEPSAQRKGGCVHTGTCTRSHSSTVQRNDQNGSQWVVVQHTLARVHHGLLSAARRCLWFTQVASGQVT
jgi:hypothetical protein